MAKIWINIEQSTNRKLQKKWKKMHQKQHKILDFSKTQTTNTIHNNTNYNRVGNYANILFTREGIRLLSKGLKYITEHNYYSHAI